MKIKAFTLIEVMVSVIIISVVGLSLLKIHSNYTNTFEFAINRIDMNEKASIVLNNYSTELDDKDRDLMEIVKSKYPDFRNDDLEKILKDEKVHIKKVEIAQIEPLASENTQGDGEDEFIDDSGEDGGVPLEPILLNRIDVKFENAGTFLYSFEFEGMEENIPVVPPDGGNDSSGDDSGGNGSGRDDSGGNGSGRDDSGGNGSGGNGSGGNGSGGNGSGGNGSGGNGFHGTSNRNGPSDGPPTRGGH